MQVVSAHSQAIVNVPVADANASFSVWSFSFTARKSAWFRAARTSRSSCVLASIGTPSLAVTVSPGVLLSTRLSTELAVHREGHESGRPWRPPVYWRHARMMGAAGSAVVGGAAARRGGRHRSVRARRQRPTEHALAELARRVVSDAQVSALTRRGGSRAPALSAARDMRRWRLVCLNFQEGSREKELGLARGGRCRGCDGYVRRNLRTGGGAACLQTHHR